MCLLLAFHSKALNSRSRRSRLLRQGGERRGAAPRSRGRANPSQGQRYCCIGHASSPRSQASDCHDSRRLGGYGRSCGRRSCGQPCAVRRECHRADLSCPALVAKRLGLLKKSDRVGDSPGDEHRGLGSRPERVVQAPVPMMSPSGCRTVRMALKAGSFPPGRVTLSLNYFFDTEGSTNSRYLAMTSFVDRRLAMNL